VNGEIFVSDDALHVLDMHFNGPLPEVETLEARLKTIPGVVECGLFIGLCQTVVVGDLDGSTTLFQYGDPLPV
jgi:ribose 5-phosphate isomerase A